ncbi:MAG TPA: DUF6804 family protein [Pseudolysinimonas sp.]|nr:DUF6804 family protein [Pseudolysinimonas sp.]
MPAAQRPASRSGSQRPGSRRPASQRPGDRYGDPKVRRTGLAPGLLGAIALLAGLALIDSPGFIVIRYLVAILAIIVGVFAFQARQWWWLPLLAAIAVIWNPVFPLDWSGQAWVGAQYIAVLVFVIAGVLIKVPTTEEDTRR